MMANQSTRPRASSITPFSTSDINSASRSSFIMKRCNSWSGDYMEKRRRFPPVEPKEDTRLEPSSYSSKRQSHAQEQVTPKTLQSRLSASKTNWIFSWIPQPPAGCGDINNIVDNIDFQQDGDLMSSMSSDLNSRKRPRTGSDATQTNGSEGARPIDYSDPRFPAHLEGCGIFMQESDAGPDSGDVAFYQRLQQETQQVPSGTCFEYLKGFSKLLSNRSETFILCNLHPLLMPCAETLALLGRKGLEHVTDSLNDSWNLAESILKRRPQPDHSRCLKPSAFDKEQLLKLDALAGEGGFQCAVRDGMYFPYLTCEIKSNLVSIEIAERQNMLSMSVALRSLVKLAETAGTLEKVHRRILGYSISHDAKLVRIHGYYPELGNETKYYRCPVAHFEIWSDGTKWKCYNFVGSLDAEFLPKHIALVKEMLAKIELPRVEVPRAGSVGSNSGDQSASGSRRKGSSITESAQLHTQSSWKRMENKQVKELKQQVTDMANTFREEARVRDEQQRVRDEEHQRETESLRQLILNMNPNN